MQTAAGSIIDKIHGGSAAVGGHVKESYDFASGQIQERVKFLDNQQEMIHSAIKNRIDNYEKALEVTRRISCKKILHSMSCPD
jgi:hypothetical protein